MRKNIFTLMLMIFCAVFAFTSLQAQDITREEISVTPAQTVNFNQLAAQERLNPPNKKHHFIEQGEDRDKDFKFIPKAVPSDAITHIAPVANQEKAAINSPAPLTSFNGIMDNETLIPPDINGAIGPNYIVETTNQQFNIYSKTGTLTGTVTITNFFASTGGSGYFDPHIVYDNTNGRFIVSMDGTYSNGDGGIFLAVSLTSDPTGSWYVYGFDGIGNTSDFLDYPLLGYNTNWVVVTGNDFINSNSPVYSKIYIMNRASLYSGTLGTVTTYTDQNAFSLYPAQTYDASQTTEYLVQDWNGNSGGNGYVQVCTITGTPGAPVFTVGNTIGINQPWSENTVGAKQSGGSKTIEEGDTRIGNALVINGSLWFCHTVPLPASTPTYSGVDWWQLNPATSTIQQYGRIADPNGQIFYYYPSINVNINGDALLGYSQSSSTTYASAGYAFHAASDAANTMETGYEYKAGIAYYYKTYGGGRNRWGDFSGTCVDPTDNSFWCYGQWANTSNYWATVIAHVPSSTNVSCNAPAGMSTTNITNTSATFNWGAISGATSYNIQYQASGASSWTTGTATTNSFNVSGLLPGTAYVWQVQTVCSGGNSAYTASTGFSTTGITCGVPSGLASGSITGSGATLAWSAVSGDSIYNVQWSTNPAGSWTTVSGLTTASYPLSGLSACTGYQFKVESVCSGDVASNYSNADAFTTTGCSVSYCSSTATNTAYEYIKNVKLGTINNNSSEGAGYVNYTSLSTTLNGNSTYTISLTPGFTGTTYNEYWTVYIDYNHNGSFTDANETVIRGSGRGAVNKSFKVPSSALNGPTRMRIQMQYGAYETNPCATFTYGEVQDFTVNITGATAKPAEADGDENTGLGNEFLSAVKLYPNPAQNYIMLEYNCMANANVKVNVYNLAGQKIMTTDAAANAGYNAQSINTSTLNSGVYILEIESNGYIQRNKFIITK